MLRRLAPADAFRIPRIAERANEDGAWPNLEKLECNTAPVADEAWDLPELHSKGTNPETLEPCKP